MPKRVIDFDAMWGSDKIASCAEWAQAEYAWLYGLADASGCFELTNLRVIWGRVAAIRRNLTIERLEQIFNEFQDKGLLFVWEEHGKRYGNWTGSDVPGRLPPPSWRMRLERLAPPVPRQQLAEYMSRFARGRANSPGGGFAADISLGARQESGSPNTYKRFNGGDEQGAKNAQAEARLPAGQVCAAGVDQGLKAGVEATHAQDWDLNLNREEKREWKRGALRGGVVARTSSQTQTSFIDSDLKSEISECERNTDLKSESSEFERERERESANCKIERNQDLKSEIAEFDTNLARSKSSSNEATRAATAGAATGMDRSCGAPAGSVRKSLDDVHRGHSHRPENENRDTQRMRTMQDVRAREKASLLARELIVGQGPSSCGAGPIRVRPEVLERIRARDAARRALAANGSRSP